MTLGLYILSADQTTTTEPIKLTKNRCVGVKSAIVPENENVSWSPLNNAICKAATTGKAKGNVIMMSYNALYFMTFR